MFYQSCLYLIHRENDEQPDVNGEQNEEQQTVKKTNTWAKPNKKQHKGKGGKKPGPVKPKQHAPSNVSKSPAPGDSKKSDNGPVQEKPTKAATATESDIDSDESDNEDKDDLGASSDENEKKSSVEDDDDVEWERLQQKLNKREKLEGKSRISHSVHSPYFPEDKQEYWWTYICDRKSRTLLTAPYHITNLVDREEVQLKFTAPRWPGVYTLTVCLRSGNVPKILTESDKVQGVDKQSCTLASKTFRINQLIYFFSFPSPQILILEWISNKSLN